MRTVSDKSRGEYQNTRMFSKVFFKNCSIHEIMWENIVKLGRPQLTI
jgi:hypothetical protein